jgi:hypothetical protein
MFFRLLEKIIKIFKNNYPIIFILFLGFSIRLYGIYFDYPNPGILIWDESYNVSFLIDVIGQHKIPPYPTSSAYPALLPILLSPIFVLRILYLAALNHLHSVAAIKDFFIGGGVGYLYIIARWYSVAFGALSILLVYFISKEAFKNKVGAYFAALAYTFSILPLAMSHWGKHHATMVFFVLLSLWLILKFEQAKKIRFFYWSVIAAAAAFATHYIGITAIIFPLAGWWFNRNLFDWQGVVKSFSIYLLLVVASYGFNCHGFQYMLHDIVESYYKPNNFSGIVPTGKWERFYYVFRDSWNIEPVFITSLAIVTLNIKNLWRNKSARYIIIGLLFNYLLMITIVVGAHLSRWLLTFISLSIILASGAFFNFLSKTGTRKILLITIGLVMILPSIYFSVCWLNLLRHNTLIEAQKWSAKNIERNEVIYSFSEQFYLPLSYDAAKWNYDHNKKYQLQKKVAYILDNKDYFANKGMDIEYDNGESRYKDLGGSNTKYLLMTFDNLKTKEGIIDNLKQYHQIKLVASFYPTEHKEFLENGIDNDYLNSPEKWSTLIKLEKGGQFTEIYKIEKF